MNTNPRYERLKPLMAEAGLDVTVVLSPENTLYFTGAYILTQTNVRDRLALAVFPVDKDPVMIGCKVESETIDLETWIEDRRYYVEFLQSPIKMLADALIEKGYENSTIGIEMDYLAANFYKELIETMPRATFVPCTRLFEKVRMIKEPGEIEIMAKYANVTRQCLEEAIRQTHPGDTEKMIATRIRVQLMEHGATGMFLVTGAGTESTKLHKEPDDTLLESGDVLRIDFGGVFEGQYKTDFCRMMMVGEENPYYIEKYNQFCDCYKRTIDMIKPGVMASEIFFACKKMHEEYGLQFFPTHVGHSLGITYHEFPMLSPKEDFALQENMVFNVEPLCVVDNRLFHVEDLVQVTKDGHKVLSDPDFNPRLLRIV